MNNGSWVIYAGDFSGDPDTYEGTVEIAVDGVNYVAAVASLNAINWTWNAASAGLVSGSRVRITITATSTGFTPTSATEIVKIV